MSLKDYYKLAKPGLVYGNLIPLIGGYVIGARGDVLPWPFAVTLAASVLGMASGCVFNNVVDHDIDAKMRRTKHRAVAAGRITRQEAMLYGAALGAAGSVIMAFGVNMLAFALGALGFFFYVVIYSMWWKRRSVWGTVVGSVSGAMPPVVGYAAATGRFDLAAIILFGTMVAWQMPHFFAIAIRHADDYAAAGIPAMPVVHGVRATKLQMLLYVVSFAAVAPLLSLAGYAGPAYLAVSLALGLAWLALCLRGFMVPEADKKGTLAWARGMFFASLVIIVALYATMTFAAVG